ncbi:MAG: AI-2E family transporter [Nanoarchaeota archaeon]|nr:AI-2E family transporter [Nanoarchaeota archaeon]
MKASRGDFIKKGNILFWAAFGALTVIVYLLLRPFLITILTGGIIAYLFYPVHTLLRKHIKKNALSAFLVTILILILVTIPLSWLFTQMIGEARINYFVVKHTIDSGIAGCDTNEVICLVVNAFNSIITTPIFKNYFDFGLEKMTDFLVTSASGFLLAIPRFILDVFIMIFVIFFSLKDGEKFGGQLKRILPFSKKSKDKLLKQINDMTYAVVYGLFVVALIEGFLGGIAFWIFGIPAPVFWGVVMFILAVIPILGPPMVWGPASLILLLQGLSNGDGSLVTKAILLALYGFLIILPIDIFLKPKIIGSRGKLHPAIVLLGVFGGVFMFGIMGVIIGPVILCLFTTFIDIYEKEIA